MQLLMPYQGPEMGWCCGSRSGAVICSACRHSLAGV